jgi:hypothetical protein
MDEELRSVKRQAAAAQDWYSVAGALERLCDYIAKRETANDGKSVVQNVDTIEEGARMTGVQIDFLG